MKILYIVPYAPSQIRVRPYQLIRALHALGHSVTVAALWSNAEEKADLDRLAGEGLKVIAHYLSASRRLQNSLRAAFSDAPLQMAFCWQPEFAAAVRKLVQTSGFDVVHVEHLRGARYGLDVQSVQLATSDSPVPIVWDSVDCITLLFQQAMKFSRSLKGRALAGLDLARTRRYEGRLVNAFDRVLVASAIDKVQIQQLAFQVKDGGTGLMGAADSNDKVVVLKNGVDLAYFRPDASPREPEQLVFSGKMSYHANVTAAIHLVKDVMPRVWAQRPNAQVWIVGKEPPSEIRTLATTTENALLGQRAAAGAVVVTGTVPDIRPYLNRATVAVAPVVYGAGIQNKVLEAMACGTPVIASPQATAALRTRRNEEVVVADDAETFAHSILQVLDKPNWQRELSLAGRAYVERNHSWATIAVQLHSVYCATIEQSNVSA